MPTRSSQLAREVKAALRFDHRTAPFADAVAVEARDGEVTLRGEVPRVGDRGAAEVVARNLPGVTGVRNLLLVGPPDRTDAEVAQAVFDAFIEDPYIDERRIRVSADHGVVTLDGEVETLTRKRLAGAIAWWMRGVRGILNNLRTVEETTPDLERDDDLLASAIKDVLAKDPLVDETEVGVIALGGVARLFGAVCGQVEKDAALSDAWATLGVRDVVDELEVVPAPTPAQMSDYQP